MNLKLSRREFLKLFASLPLIRIAGDLLPLGLGSQPAVTQGSPNVMIVVFDALSAANMSLYGYPRQTTPNISKFAEISTVFHRHYAGGNFTSPGTASILTGVYPWTNRVFHMYGTTNDFFEENNIFASFPEETYTRMAFTHNDLVSIQLHQFANNIDVRKSTKELCLFNEYFADEIFEKDRNAAFLGEWMVTRGQRGQDIRLPSSLFLSVFHHLWRNKERQDANAAFQKLFPRGLPSTNAGPYVYLLEDAIDWVEDQIENSTKPYFGYFHFLPPHEPYNTRKEFVDTFMDDWEPVSKPAHYFSQGLSKKTLNEHRRDYDEYILYVDAEFGRLIDFMRKRGLLDNTYVIFTSDHGEMFERGILEHITPTLYEPIVHVPLIIHQPKQTTGENVQTLTSCVDLLPTMHRIIGQPLPEWSEGIALPTFSDQPADSERSVFVVEAKSNPKNGPLQTGTVAILKGQYKLIHYMDPDDVEIQDELYDLANDPEELENLYTSQKSIAEALQNELFAKIQEVNQPYQKNS